MTSSTSVPRSENPDAKLAAALAARTRFATLLHVAETESTQELAVLAEGCALVWADHQTRGRGRQGRLWCDQRGRDLALSFRVEGLSLSVPGRLAAAAPVAVARALAPVLGQPPRIKWPNDLYVQGRKLSGLLIDAVGSGPRSSFVLGIGINVNGDRLPDELSEHATSLALLTGREWDRHALALGVAEALEGVLVALEAGAGEVEALARAFADGTGLVGRRVRLEGPRGEPHGVLERLDLEHAVVAGLPPIPLGLIRQIRS